jgi:hypothetical protein
VRTLLAATLVAAASVAVAVPSTAAPTKPKNFTQEVTFTDATPDPSGNANSGNENHCSGKLPKEAAFTVKVPGPGDVDVALSGMTGDWGLQILDATGSVIGGDDQTPPALESSSVRLKKAGTIMVLPCNEAGTPTAKVTIKYSYRK